MSPSSEIQPVASDRANAFDQAVEESDGMQDAAPSAGQRLREAREVRGLTIDEVATRLKLSPDQVVALESDEFSRMHCNTIARGFIRNYARLLGLDATELMDALGRSVTLRQNVLAVPGSTNIPILVGGRLVSRRNHIWIAAGFGLLFAMLLIYPLLPADFIRTMTSSIKGVFGATAAQTETAQTPSMPEASSSSTAPATSAVSASESTISPPVIIAPGVAPSAPTAPVDGGDATPVALVPSVAANVEDNVLRFSFTQSSWVEVKDRSGKVIFSQLNPPNSQREVSGQPPFSLLIGNAGSVSLSYRGKPVDLSKRSKDDVARVTLE